MNATQGPTKDQTPDDGLISIETLDRLIADQDPEFHGTMAELLSAIAENREPSNSAANNLKSLELCFAAIASSHTGQPVKPGSVRRLHVAIPKS